MANDFHRDYESLQIARDARWDDAQSSYRKLVHQWHPDRYALRPRELAHAQKRFIELTKSFNNLRNFHRLNQRLPFEQKAPSATTSSVMKEQQRIDPVGATEADLEILNKSKKTSRANQTSKSSPWLWTALTGLLLVGSLALMFVIDDRARKQNLEKAREVLQQSRPSEFLPNKEDIKKRNNRGAILTNSAKGKLGDRLLPNAFR